MYPLTFHGVFRNKVVFALQLFFRRKIRFIYLCNFGGDIRQYEKIRVLTGFCNQVQSVISKFYLVVFFIYAEVQFSIYFRHVLLLVCQVIVFTLLQFYPVARLTQEFYQCTVLRQTAKGTHQCKAAVFGIIIALGYFFLCFY